jgi:large subunit ribosomal protein L17
MRHRKTISRLSRTTAHRKATLANLSSALFERKHIKTTEAKAKATRRFSEKLISLAKSDSVHARRLAFQKLHQKKIVKVLFDEIAPNFIDRPGGYTRIIKLGQRPGDGAHMAVLELVGYEMASKKKKEKEPKEGTKNKKSTTNAEAKDTSIEEKKKEVKKKEVKKKEKDKKKEKTIKTDKKENTEKKSKK